MASSVFYKFNSRKDESRVTFDGTGISVFDLKRDIILANNMGKANDFDLFIYDSSSNKEYTDDTEIIPRSSSVVVKRRPAARPGKGKASMYIAGAGLSVPTSEPVQRGGPGAGSSSWHKGAMSKRFDVKDEPLSSSVPKPSVSAKPAADDDEASAMAAMFQAQTANWEETQEKMSHAQRIYNTSRGTGFSRGGKPHTPHQAPPQPDRPLPPSYVCYRCGQKGHWIQDCPTNNDREFDHRPRIKRTTGIPRSMLKAVENPNIAELGQGVMVTPDGGYVVAQPDSASWQKQVSRPKGLTVAEVRERMPSDPSLVCPIDNKLFRDAVKTPCCGTHYCEECIQTHLLERDFVCPNCAKKIASLDKLVTDKPMRTKVTDYIENVIEESKKEGGDEDAGANASSGAGTASTGQDPANAEQDFYGEQANMDMSKMVADSIPQLQAQIAQISAMLQNPALPNQVRQNTQMQHHHLQVQLAQAQEMATAIALAGFQQQQLQNTGMNFNNMHGYNQAAWTNNGFPQQSGQDSAYQRLPVNNRRRVLKRDRPQDFLEVGGEHESKVARYWE
ncbi:DWNN domain-containing protein [Mycena latifolia]|nr:DWNN domain-containing protein [Mycena latifolia]